ncbi:MAG TPA: hypothetical protein VGJ20_11620 [Xanthobacteraceae bacterium]|jgi:hypothetical protein
MSRRIRGLRRIIFIHEAGHAVVARKLGVEIADIDMTANDDDSVAHVQTYSATSAGVALASWHASRPGLPMQPGPHEPKVARPGEPLHTAALAILERARAETIAMLEDN